MTWFSDGFILSSAWLLGLQSGSFYTFPGFVCAVFLDDEEGVAGLKVACAVGDYVAVAAADHHDEVAWGAACRAGVVALARWSG